MNLLTGLNGLRSLAPGAVLSIGNFDGIHLGHRRLLSMGRALRDQHPGARLAVATFEPHPFTVLRPGKAPPRLTPVELKRRLLAGQGVDDLVELAPEPGVLDLTAENFWEILRDQVRPRHLVEGNDFNFGKARAGNIERLREWAAGSDVTLHIAEDVEAPLLDLHVVPVSSTLIRWLLARGRVRDAAICLGRAYSLCGPVIKGHQRGRALGVPTANLDCREQLIPADGVYAARCAIEGTTWLAALSIGTLPTFGDSSRQVEAHLIGFNGDLYGRTICVEIIDWLREQWKFSSLDALKERMTQDIAETVNRAGDDAARAIGAI